MKPANAKKTLLALLFTLAAVGGAHRALAALQGTPFMPEADNRFNCLESGTCSGPGAGAGFASTSISGGALKALSVPFSSLITGVATGAGGAFPATLYKATMSLAVAANTYNTSIVLPAKTIIRQAYMIFPIAPANTSGTTTAFQCDAANDILSAADETAHSAGDIIAGVETGTAATMHYTSAGCTVKLVTAVHTGTLGNVELFLDTVPAN